MHLYSVKDLTDLLVKAGFTSFEALDDGLEPFELDSHRLWLVATRQMFGGGGPRHRGRVRAYDYPGGRAPCDANEQPESRAQPAHRLVPVGPFQS